MAGQTDIMFKTACPHCGQSIFRITPPAFKEHCFACGHSWQAAFEEVKTRPIRGSLPLEAKSERALKEQILIFLKKKGKTLSLYNLKAVEALISSPLNLIYVPMYFQRGVYAAAWNEHKTKTVQKRQYDKSLHRYKQVSAKEDYVVHKGDTAEFEALTCGRNLEDMPQILRTSCKFILTDDHALSNSAPQDGAPVLNCDLASAAAFKEYGNKGLKEHVASKLRKVTRLSVKGKIAKDENPAIAVPFYYGRSVQGKNLEAAGCAAQDRFSLFSTKRLTYDLSYPALFLVVILAFIAYIAGSKTTTPFGIAVFLILTGASYAFYKIIKSRQEQTLDWMVQSLKIGTVPRPAGKQ